jgi:hypothetical protein
MCYDEYVMDDEKPGENGLLNYIVTTLETVRDEMATKSDLHQVELRLSAEIAAVRGDVEQVQLRLNTIERALTTRLN